MSNSVGSVSIDLEARMARFESDVGRAARILQQQMESSARAATRSIEQMRQSIESDLGKMTSAASTAATALKGLFAFEALKGGVRSLVDAQVQMQGIHYTLVSVAGSAAAADAAFGFVEKTADRLGMNLKDAATGFSQLSASASANGVAMRDQQKLFTALGEASTVLHLSSTQTQAALLALTQMFSKGKIQAQELTLQLGQAIPGVVPRFQQAVLAMKKGTADAGLTFEQLMEQGKLTAKDVLPQLTESIAAAGKGWQQAATGLNAELNRFGTAWFKLKANLSGGLFDEAATGTLRVVARNLNGIASAVTAVGAAYLVAFAGRSVSALGAWIAQQARLIVLTDAQNAMTAAAAKQDAIAAGVKLQKARSAYVEAEASAALAAQQKVNVQMALALADADIVAVRASALLATGELELARASQQLTEVEAARSAVLAELNVATAAAARNNAYMVAARRELTAATLAQNAAMAGSAAAASASTGAMALLARGASGLLALIGGIPGLLIAGAAAITYYIHNLGQQADEAKQKIQGISSALAAVDAYNTHPSADTFQSLLDSDIDKKLQSLISARDKAQKTLDEWSKKSSLPWENWDPFGEKQDAQRAVSRLNREIETVSTALEQAGITAAKSAAQMLGFGDALDAVTGAAGPAAADIAKLDGALAKQLATLTEHRIELTKGAQAALEWQARKELGLKADQELPKSTMEAIKAIVSEKAAITAATEAHKQHTKAIKDTEKAAKEYAAFLKESDKLNAKAAEAVDSYLGKNLTPMQKAWSDYAEMVRKVADAEGERIAKAQEAVAAGNKNVNVAAVEADAQKRVADAIEQSNGKLRENLVLAQQKMDLGQKMADAAMRDARIATLNERDQAIARASIAASNEALAQHRKLTDADVQAQIRLAEQGAAYAYDLQKQAEFAKQVAQEYTGFWENAASSIARAMGDLFTGQTKKFRDFGQQLKSIAQQFVSDIVSQFLRLRILGPILNGAMGSMAGWLGIGSQFLGGSSITASANYYGNGGTISQSPGAIGGAGGAGGYAGYLQNGVQAYKAYQWAANGGLWGSGLAGGAGNVSQVGIHGMTYGVNGASGGTAVAFNPYATSYSPLGGTFSIGGYSAPYASAAGGLLGAYYGSQRGGGGFSTVASTASYGALGAGIAGTAAGVAGGASLGTAAGSAFGAAAASTSWIPIVGWIMAGLAALDSFSGGKVFGTKWRPAQSNVSLGLGPEGATASANELLWKYKGQTGLSLGGFLTGGLSQLSWWGDKKTKLEQLPVTPEMLKAAQQLYDSVEKVLVSGAQKLGIDVPEMIQASLTAQTTYNKKGKVQGTEYIVQYMGQTWKEATAEAASQRIGADALLSVVAKSAGDVAFAIAKQWQERAATLEDGVQTLLAAQQDIVRGNSLIALGSTATLKQVIGFVQGLQADGEKLADTYNRLMQASQAYVQFVGQFAPTSNSFGASLEAIAKQMQANIDQANALAQAAGMQHAAEQDLVNIHQFAAKQAADAIAQLSSAAQDLATKLYGVTNNSLQAVSAQLDKLAGKTQSALQLAIGDNSPLGGKEKLDLALQGLRSGLTSADDVLALGRKLYASSADYTGLFNKVQDILGLPGAGGQQSLQDAIKQYAQLAGQRDQLQGQADATARFADAKTLAQYVADISTTHGIGYSEAASGLGFNLADLAKDLGVNNIAGYLDSLKLQDIAGSTMESSSAIVDAIQKLGRDLIQTLTGAPITTTSGATGSQATATAEQTALLKSIDARLAAIEGSTGDTAATNKSMARDSLSGALRDIAGSARGVTA